jgi:hypothetical protein
MRNLQVGKPMSASAQKAKPGGYPFTETLLDVNPLAKAIRAKPRYKISYPNVLGSLARRYKS